MAAGTAPDALRYGSTRGRWVIAATVLGSSMSMLDSTVVGVALPVIGRDFKASIEQLQWVVNAYLLTLAGLLLLAGSLADRYGRRKLFVIGVAWFALSSALCTVAWNAESLVAARALQGIGGALLTPGSLAILQASFAPGDRGKAIGAWSGLGGVAAAAGPLAGGYLVDAVSWRLIFAINLPIAAVTIWLALKHVPESRLDGASAQHLDVVGAALTPLGLGALTYGLIAGPERGWASPIVVGSLAAGVLLLGAFVLVERRSKSPLIPLGLFASRQFSTANLVTFVLYGALGGVLFLLPIVLQQGAGYSAIQAGLSLLPFTVLMLTLSARAGSLADRIGPRLPMTAGPVLAGIGIALFTRIDGSGSYLTQVLPAVLVFGLGMVITVAPLTAAVLAAAPGNHTGVASAINNDLARAAGLIAVAVLPSAAGITGDAYRDPLRLISGFHTAVLLAAGFAVFGGIAAWFGIRNPRRTGPAPAPCTTCALTGPPVSREQFQHS
ncbi:MAG: putative transrane efflux protein [Actinomycetia bacterium]|nr:putative transrane efflux protein [Actinomycetes bacterium]